MWAKKPKIKKKRLFKSFKICFSPLLAKAQTLVQPFQQQCHTGSHKIKELEKCAQTHKLWQECDHVMQPQDNSINTVTSTARSETFLSFALQMSMAALIRRCKAQQTSRKCCWVGVIEKLLQLFDTCPFFFALQFSTMQKLTWCPVPSAVDSAWSSQRALQLQTTFYPHFNKFNTWHKLCLQKQPQTNHLSVTYQNMYKILCIYSIAYPE